jgi:hypothetical protein
MVGTAVRNSGLPFLRTRGRSQPISDGASTANEDRAILAPMGRMLFEKLARAPTSAPNKAARFIVCDFVGAGHRFQYAPRAAHGMIAKATFAPKTDLLLLLSAGANDGFTDHQVRAVSAGVEGDGYHGHHSRMGSSYSAAPTSAHYTQALSMQATRRTVRTCGAPSRGPARCAGCFRFSERGAY